jgi:hypothetical protein
MINYEEYIKSKQWQAVAAYYRKEAKYKCQYCGGTGGDVHHISYKHLGDELNHPEDVEILCRRCHDIKHMELEGLDKDIEWLNTPEVRKLQDGYLKWCWNRVTLGLEPDSPVSIDDNGRLVRVSKNDAGYLFYVEHYKNNAGGSK